MPATATREAPATFTPAPTPTPPPPTPTWEPLTAESDPEAVRLRILNSHLSWQTLYAELQSTEYPPEGSDLLVRIRRYQVWIEQPGRALVLSGRRSEPPSAVFVSDGQRYRLVYPEAARDEQDELQPAAQAPFFPPQALSETIYPHPLGGLIGYPVGEVLFPAIFGQRQGTFHVVGSDTVAGRPAVIVDWTAPTGFIADRFRVDAATGLLLRQQNLGKTGAGEVVQSDIVVTRIVYDLEIPDDVFRLDQADEPHYLEPPPS